jgi:hypothetical protein
VIKLVTIFVSAAAVASVALTAQAAQEMVGKVGVLSCDVSAGVGLFVVEKQTMTCAFKPDKGGPVDQYTGKIDEYGIALGEVKAGRLDWVVIATAVGVPHGALAGQYAGVGADASVGAGVGANVLVGGTGRAFSLQPLSVEGEVGLNLAAGITTVTLTSAAP